MSGTGATCTTSTTNRGKRRTFEHDPRASALDVIRDQARLTGAKLVCGAGVCGAHLLLSAK